jgi:hypothetical protein
MTFHLPPAWATFAERHRGAWQDLVALYAVDDELPPEPGRFAPWSVAREWKPPEGMPDAWAAAGSFKATGGFAEETRRLLAPVGGARLQSTITPLADGLLQVEAHYSSRADGKTYGIGFFTFAPKGATVPAWRVPHGAQVRTAEGRTGRLDWFARWQHGPFDAPIVADAHQRHRITPDTLVTVVDDPKPAAVAHAARHAANDYIACFQGSDPSRCTTRLPDDLPWPPAPRGKAGHYTPTELDAALAAVWHFPEVEAVQTEVGHGTYPETMHSAGHWRYYVRDEIQRAASDMRDAIFPKYGAATSIPATPALLVRWRTSPDLLELRNLTPGYHFDHPVTVRPLARTLARARALRAVHAAMLAAPSAERAAELYRDFKATGGYMPPEMWRGVLETHGLDVGRYRGKSVWTREDELSAYEINSPEDVRKRRAQVAREYAAGRYRPGAR